MLIVSWNVNSIRARLTHLLDLIKEINPDIILLQEIKVTHASFPHHLLEDCGYSIVINGEKSYNGVAILAKGKIYDVITPLEEFGSRYIEAIIEIGNINLRVASVYVPNGGGVDSSKFENKILFLQQLRECYKRALMYDEIFIAGGDYNIAPEDIDVYDPNHFANKIGFHPLEHAEFRALLSLELFDSFRLSHPNSKEFSWWDYRGNGFMYDKGMRIDQILINARAADALQDSEILSNFRNVKNTSDHAPLFLKLKI